MICELRFLELVLNEMGMTIRAEWLPSVINKYADSLSRRLPHGDPQIL